MAHVLVPRCTNPHWGKQIEHEQCGAIFQITREDLFRVRMNHEPFKPLTVQVKCPECDETIIIDKKFSHSKWGILPGDKPIDDDY